MQSSRPNQVKLFLSRDQAGEVLSTRARQSGWELICFSCIEKKLTSKDPPPAAEWIFFYSPSAVHLFLAAFKTFRAKRAALGEGTARAFRLNGIQPDFVGSSSDPSEVMREFREVVSRQEQVVQARGEKSFERLREVLPEEQIIDWPFYRTESKAHIPEVTSDVYIFTSPSNAEAYLEKYGLPANARAVVFGESTRKAVEKYANAEIVVTAQPGEEGAVKAIEGLSD